jgi:hypothetical protein
MILTHRGSGSNKSSVWIKLFVCMNCIYGNSGYTIISNWFYRLLSQVNQTPEDSAADPINIFKPLAVTSGGYLNMWRSLFFKRSRRLWNVNKTFDELSITTWNVWCIKSESFCIAMPTWNYLIT